MTAGELIKILKKVDPDTIIVTWDGFNDDQTSDIYVSKVGLGHVMITDSCVGIDMRED